MANKIGQLKCSFNSKNTGYGSCFEEWKVIAGALIYDSPRFFTAEEIEALQETLAADALADSKSARMFPVHNFVTITDSTEAPVIETFGYGAKGVVRDGDYDWTFQYTDGGNCLQQALRTHNGKRWVLFYDRDNKILGYNGRNSMAAIPLQYMYALPWKPATGSNAAQYLLQFVFLAKYINENRAFVKADFDPSEIQGLQDVDIVINSFNQDTGVANIILQTNCGAENLYDQYGTQLADPDNLTAFDQDGNEVAIDTIAKVAGSKSFDVTFDTGDLPASGTVTLAGAVPSVLAGNNVVGYEIGQVDLEIVAS